MNGTSVVDFGYVRFGRRILGHGYRRTYRLRAYRPILYSRPYYTTRRKVRTTTRPRRTKGPVSPLTRWVLERELTALIMYLRRFIERMRRRLYRTGNEKLVKIYSSLISWATGLMRNAERLLVEVRRL